METSSEPRPSRLFKYQPCSDHALENLRQHSLWYSHPNDFNDPFDCSVPPTIVNCNSEEEWLSVYLRHETFARQKNPNHTIGMRYPLRRETNQGFKKKALDTSRKNAQDIFLNRRTTAGISCLSENNLSLVMWSHYADFHKGFCLEFDTVFPPFSEAKAVQYELDLHINTLSPYDVYIDRNLEPFVKFFLIKATDWQYEHEWRMIRPDGNSLKEYDPMALTAISLGYKINPEHREQILDILNGTDTKVFQMQPAQEKFKLEAVPIK